MRTFYRAQSFLSLLLWGLEESLPPLPPNCPVYPLTIPFASIINNSLCLNVQLTNSPAHFSSHQVYLLRVSCVPSAVWTLRTKNTDPSWLYLDSATGENYERVYDLTLSGLMHN